MLQQTQTYRVQPKYEIFITELPTLESLAQASLKDVLSLWQGLGYNRRGKFLHKCAQQLMKEHAGIIPNDPQKLVLLPGIGKATAASICAFAFNNPTLFIETNIRAVYIHHFFKNSDTVHDNELMPLIAATLDIENAREWYYALMDYGVHLKKMCPNPSRKSKHHTTQSKFEGSDRQIRGHILRLLTNHEQMNIDTLIATTDKDASRVLRIVAQLCDEGFIKQNGTMLSIN
jgi:A/G-specific adenine glycosylase